MASLKDLRSRITSVKSTQRITSAMKMVAAAKLRRAQEMAVAARPYAQRMERMLGSLAAGTVGGGPALLAGTGRDAVHLLVLMTTDRGLCGSFNAQLMRGARTRIRQMQAEGKQVKLFIIGRKGVVIARREFPELIVGSMEEVIKPAPVFSRAADLAATLRQMFANGEFDTCTLVFNRFLSALTQEVTFLQLIPFKVAAPTGTPPAAPTPAGSPQAVYEFEPEEEEILADLLPRNLAMQIFRAKLETFASEQGARMTAMDNASRNAGDMIRKLTQIYNRSRQAMITKELIEIISGAEAV